MVKLRIAFAIFFIFELAACKKSSSEGSQELDPLQNTVLAEYKEQKLRFKDIQDYLPDFNNEQDSIQYLSQRVETWLRDQSFLDLAVSHYNKIEEIEELVSQYRNSLIANAYEEKLIGEKLDSNISDEEINEYYNQKKGEYKLDDAIIRLLYVKIAKSGFDEKSFLQLWNRNIQNNDPELLKYCQNNSDYFILQTDKWHKWKDLESFMPSKFISLSNLFSGLNRDFADFKYQYFIKVLEIVKPNEKPPVSYYSLQAEKSILHERAKRILENEKQKQFEKRQLDKTARNLVK